uniref:Uncharacterized protein n=1 Tax=Anguilla anguilla TaxID=7936 RepID=A0A0E9VD04_ANGAN
MDITVPPPMKKNSGINAGWCLSCRRTV